MTVKKTRVLLIALLASFVSVTTSVAKDDDKKGADAFWKDDLVWETLDNSPKRVWVVDDKKSKEAKKKDKDKNTPDSWAPSGPNADDLLNNIFQHKDLSSKKIAVEVKGPATKVEDIIKLISKSADINFVIDPSVTGTFGQITLTDLTPGEALQYILENNNPRLALVNSFGMWRIMPYSEAKKLLQLSDQDVYAVFNLKHANVDEKFTQLIMDGWKNIAGPSSQNGFVLIDDVRKQVFVRNDKYLVERFKEFLQSVDRAVDQVRIDVILVSVTKNRGCSLGLNFSGIYNRAQTLTTNNKNFGFAGFGGRLENFGYPAEKPGDSYRPAFNPTLNTFNLFTRAINSAVSFVQIPFVFGGPDLNSRRLNAVLTAAETESKLKVLARPSLLISNHESGKLAVGQNIPITTRSTEGVGSSSRSDSKVDYREIGIKLEIKPTINENGTVALDIFFEQSSVVSGSTQVNEFGVMEAPPVIGNNKTKTTLVLKNGQTSVIGGLKEHRAEIERNRVPIIWRLPLVGNLFKSNYNTSVDTEQYFFVTATIVEK